MDDLHLLAAARERAVVADAPLQVRDEALVDLDSIEAVVGKHVPGDGAGHGAGAGTDLQDPGGAARLAQVIHQGAGEEPAGR